jgi:outer membrane protein OmpA-like peptidoglycan-associated protein
VSRTTDRKLSGSRFAGFTLVAAVAVLTPSRSLAQSTNLDPGNAPQAAASDVAFAFALAVEDLERGRLLEGQRRLEVLIARFPDSPYANAARTMIAEGYAARSGGSVCRSGLGVAVPSPSATWQVEVRRDRGLADSFRSQAGDRVFFGPGSADLGARAHEAIAAQARWLKAHPWIPLIVEGHADDPRSPTENRALSERRAEAVRRRLIVEGVDPSRIGIAVRGAIERVALCEEAMCAAQNRRVVSVIDDAGPGLSGRQGWVAYPVDNPAARADALQ